jgi:hypothetical protein
MGMGRGSRERGRRVNMVQTMYTLVCKSKNDTCRNCSRIWGGGMRERSGEGNSRMIYLIHCKNLCKWYNVPTASTIKNNIK